MAEGYKIKIKGFLKHVKNSRGNLLLISKRMNVSREAIYKWLERNPSYWEYIYDEREQRVDIAEAKLDQKLDANEDWAIQFVLGKTNRGRMRGYGDKLDIEHSGKVDVKAGIQLIIHEKNEK